MATEILTKGMYSVLVILIAVGLFMFWINMLIHCLRRNFKNPSEKVLWFFFIILFQAIGALIYWVTVSSKEKDLILC